MLEAIDNHKKLEEIVREMREMREMREITQTLILETVPGVRRRKPLSSIPKASEVSAIQDRPPETWVLLLEGGKKGGDFI